MWCSSGCDAEPAALFSMGVDDLGFCVWFGQFRNRVVGLHVNCLLRSVTDTSSPGRMFIPCGKSSWYHVLLYFIFFACCGSVSSGDSCFVQEKMLFCSGAEIGRFRSLSSLVDMKDVTTIDVSFNSIPSIGKEDFLDGHLARSLQHLNLSHNLIESWKEASFSDLVRVKVLDLSYNKLTVIGLRDFEGMRSLEKLYLSGNPLTQIFDSFDDLPQFSYLDLESTPLICDCALEWLSKDRRAQRVREGHKRLQLSEKETCFTPVPVRGRLLHTMDSHEFSCQTSIELPVFGISPSDDQIVYPGTAVNLTCRATKHQTLITQVRWSHNGVAVPVTEHEYPATPANGLTISVISIPKIAESHEGNWTCGVWIGEDNHETRTVRLVVPGNSYCPENVTSTKRGTIEWPRTLAKNVPLQIPCPENDLSFASHVCDSSGQWTKLNVSACRVASQFGRIMREYVTTYGSPNSVVDERVINSAMNLMRKYLVAQPAEKVLPSSDEVMLLMEALEGFAAISPKLMDNTNSSSDFLAIVDWLLEAPYAALKAAQDEKALTRKILEVIRSVGQSLKARELDLSFKNFAFLVLPVVSSTSQGLYCTVNTGALLHLHCGDPSARLIRRDTVVATMDIAPDILRLHYGKRLQILAFRNVKLFAAVMDEDYAPATVAVGIFSGEKGMESSSQLMGGSITWELNIPSLTDVGKLVSMDPSLDSGNVTCEITGVFVEKSVARLSCSRFGIVLMAQPYELLHAYHTGKLSLRVSVIIWLAMIFCAVSYTILILVYAVNFAGISIVRCYKHVLLNVWISLEALILVFLCGFTETVERLFCISMGLLLHALTLCVVCWILNGFFVSFTEARKSLKEQHIMTTTKPSKNCHNVGCLYLFGWGIPLIIPAICSAFSLSSYANQSVCYLSLTYSPYALILPVGISLCSGCVYVVLIFTTKVPRKTLSSKHRAEVFDEVSTIRTHTVVLFSALVLFLLSYVFVWLWASGFRSGDYPSLRMFYELCAGGFVGATALLFLVACWMYRPDIPKVCWRKEKSVSSSGASRTVIPVQEMGLLSSSQGRSTVSGNPQSQYDSSGYAFPAAPRNSEYSHSHYENVQSSYAGSSARGQRGTEEMAPLNMAFGGRCVSDRSCTVTSVRKGYMSDSSKKETCI